MKAVVLERPGELSLVDRPEPASPGPDEVLVATRRVGLCGTDYHAFDGNQNFFTYPRVLGHELSVEVLDVGSGVGDAAGGAVRGVRAGDLCAVLPYLPCGRCVSCRRGRMNCCERLDLLGVTIDGGLCERFVVPASALFGRPGLDLDALALVETLGIGFHAVERSGIEAGQPALIVGAGPIGLALAQSLLARQAHVMMTDINDIRLGSATALVPVMPVGYGEGFTDRLRDAGDGDLPWFVFDATGNRQSMESSLGLVAFTGSLVLVGHTTGDLTYDNPTLHRREITVVTSRNARAEDWRSLLDLIESGVVGATSWITSRTTLDTVAGDMPAWGASDGTVLKGIVDVNEPLPDRHSVLEASAAPVTKTAPGEGPGKTETDR